MQTVVREVAIAIIREMAANHLHPRAGPPRKAENSHPDDKILGGRNGCNFFTMVAQTVLERVLPMSIIPIGIPPFMRLVRSESLST